VRKRDSRPPDADPATVLDANGLTDQYRRGISAALPRGVEPPEHFWRDLETAVAGYIGLQQSRAKRPPIAEVKRWQKIDRLVDKLGDELWTIRRQSPSNIMWTNEALAALREVKLKAESRLVYRSIDRAFSGRRNPHHAYLYGAVCDLWRGHLGQALAYSRADKGVPRGPVIRFFAACVNPFLGDKALTDYGIGEVIDRERERRNKLAKFFGDQK
jgi:hypothetical protein